MSSAKADYRAIVQALYAASGRRDWPAAEAYLTDDLVVSEGAHMPMAGRWQGRGALRELFDLVFGMFDIATLDLLDITVGDTHAVCVLDMVLAGTPPVRVPLLELFRFRGDLICEIRPYYFDPAALIDRAKG